jgi:TolA-binding protein
MIRIFGHHNGIRNDAAPPPRPAGPGPCAVLLGAAFLLFACGGNPVVRVPELDTGPGSDETLSADVPGYGATETAVAAAYEKFLREHPEADPGLRAAGLKRLADLSLTLEHKRFLRNMEAYDRNPVGPPPLVNYQKAIGAYNRLLEEYPDYADTDSVLYSLSRAYSEMGERDKAFQTLLTLWDRHPEAAYRQETAFRLGEAYFDRGDFKEAAAAYREALKPDDPDLEEKARYKLGWSYFNTGQYDSAVETFLPLVEQPEAALYWETLTYMSLGLRQTGGPPAIAAFFRKIGPRPFEPDLYRMAGNQYVGEGKPAMAVETYRTFVREHPLDPSAPVFASYVIDSYKVQKRPVAVRRARTDWVDRYNSESAWYAANGAEARARTRPILKESLHRLAMASHARALDTKAESDYREAVGWYRRFLLEFPDEEDTPEFRFFLAEALYELKEYGEAAGLYSAVARETPDSERRRQSAYGAIVSYEKSETDPSHPKFAESALYFADAFPQDSRSPLVLIKSGQYLFDQGRYPDAREIFAGVLRGYPNHDKSLMVQRLIGHAYMKEGNYAAAHDAYSKVLRRLKPDDEKGHNETKDLIAAALYKLGESFKEKKNSVAAANTFARIAEEAPESRLAGESLFEAGELLESSGKPVEAAAMFERLTRKFPESDLSGRAWVKIGLIEEARNDSVAAADAFVKAFTHTGEAELDPKLLWSAATNYREAGRTEKSYSTFRMFSERFPDHPDAAEAVFNMASIRKEQGRNKEALALYARVGTSAPATYFGAQSRFEIAEASFLKYDSVRLVAPLDKNLKKKSERMKKTIDLYVKAMESGYAEVVTASTYRVGEAYERFKDALLASEVPKELTEDQREAYSYQLEERAFPFEEKAVEAYENNISRLRKAEGPYDEWTKKTYRKLAELRPALYRRPEREERIISDLDWEAFNNRESERRMRGMAGVKR